MSDILAYAYEAALHCPDCARARFGINPDSDKYIPSESDSNYIPFDVTDREGNPVTAMLSTDERDPLGLSCDTCRARIYDAAWSDRDFILGMQSGYLEAIEFTDLSCPDWEEVYGKELSDYARAACDAECESFFRENRATLLQSGIHPDQAGHDFWLTRNGHGAGFWDRGLGDAGDTLTRACGHGTKYPSVDLFANGGGEVDFASYPDYPGDPSLTIDNRGDHLMLSVDSAVERYMLMQAVEDGRDVSLYDALIEPFACNGGYTVIDPNYHAVGLTSDPYILAEHATIEDDGGVTIEGGLYHYPDYQIKNLVRELALGNLVKLIRFHNTAGQPEKIERA